MTVRRTFLRFLQAEAVELAFAVEVVLVELALVVEVDEATEPLRRHLHDFVIWLALTPGMAERVRALKI